MNANKVYKNTPLWDIEIKKEWSWYFIYFYNGIWAKHIQEYITKNPSLFLGDWRFKTIGGIEKYLNFEKNYKEEKSKLSNSERRVYEQKDWVHWTKVYFDEWLDGVLAKGELLNLWLEQYDWLVFNNHSKGWGYSWQWYSNCFVPFTLYLDWWKEDIITNDNLDNITPLLDAIKRKDIEIADKVNEIKKITEDYNKKLEREIEKAHKEWILKWREDLLKVPEVEKSKIKKSKEWDNIVIDDNVYNVLMLSFDKNMPLLLKWPSGTGKSSMIKALWRDKWLDVYQYNFNWDTTVENLLWHKVLVGQKSAKDAPMEFEYWPLARAVKYGWIFQAEEINSCSVDVQFILNGLLENNDWELWILSVQGNNWEIIKPHKDFRFYGSYNPWYLWTKSFSMSIMSRFIWVDIAPMNKNDEIALLSKKFPSVVPQIKALVTLEEELRKDKNFTYDISTRDVIQCLKFVEAGFWLIQSICATIENSLQLDLDRDTLKNKISSLKIS